MVASDPGPDDATELTVLNRVFRYTPDGFEYEADVRQAEKLLEGLSLNDNCNTAAKPGLKPLTEQLIKDEQLQATPNSAGWLFGRIICSRPH